MLRRILPVLRRGIASSTVPGVTPLPPRYPSSAATSSSLLTPQCPSSAPSSSPLLPPRCASSAATYSSLLTPRCPSSAAISSPLLPRYPSSAATSSSLLTPRCPPSAASSSPLLPRYPSSAAISSSLLTPRCPSSAASSSPLLPRYPSSAATSSSLLSFVRPMWKTPFINKAPRRVMQSFKCSFCTTTNTDAGTSGGPILDETQLPTEFDWSRYIHVKKFDCGGQELCTDAIPLKAFVSKNSMTEVRKIYGNRLNDVDPHGNPVIVKEEDLFVKESAKRYTKNLIDGMAEFHGAGICVLKLDHTNVVVVAGGSTMKYTGLVFVPATLKLKRKNFIWLKTVLKEDLFEGKPTPCDMDHLLWIMETVAVESEYLMRNFVALVPQPNKSALFLRLVEPLKIMIFQDPAKANAIMKVLPHRRVWRRLMLQNDVLKSIFTHGKGYDTAADVYIFVLCYKHGCYHKCDRCCHPITREQMYTAEQFEDIQESTFPGFVGQLEVGLKSELPAAKIDELL